MSKIELVRGSVVKTIKKEEVTECDTIEKEKTKS